MKKEREIYLKPLTHREQVVMEQGICASSIMAEKESGVKATKHETGFDGDYNSNGFEIDNGWN